MPCQAMDHKSSLFAESKPYRQSIHLQIAESIQEMIAEHKLQVGDRLPPIRELARLFDVNPSTVSEALRLLQQRGLVEMKVGSGTYPSCWRCSWALSWPPNVRWRQ